MDRDACLDSLLVYIQIKIKVEEDEFSVSVLCLTKTKPIWLMTMLQAGKASLSANAPACVAVWDWEEPAGCVQRRAPPPACGTALDLGDWKGKRTGGSSVCRMFWGGEKGDSYEKHWNWTHLADGLSMKAACKSWLTLPVRCARRALTTSPLRKKVIAQNKKRCLVCKTV